MTTTGTTRTTPTGSFNHAAIASTRIFDPTAALDPDLTIHGLNLEAGYIWGTLRDGDGHVYSIMRRIPAHRDPDADTHSHSLGGKLILLQGGDGIDLAVRKEPRLAPSSDAIIRTVTDAGAFDLSAPANEHGRSMKLTLTADAMAYTETDVIDVAGTIVVPPLQWYLPGPESSLLYLTQTWLVEGTILGRDVRGFLFWEEAWMPPGGRLYVNKDPLLDADYLSWYSWANHYAEDNSTEVGHFLFGNGGFGVAIISRSDGTWTTAGHDMDLTVTRGAEGYWHEGISYTIAGEKWVCEPDPHGRMGLGQVPNPQQEARMRRVDDNRVPDVWMAWGETVPANGERRRW